MSRWHEIEERRHTLTEQYPEAEFEGGHIVVSDGDYDDSFIEYCRRRIQNDPPSEYLTGNDGHYAERQTAVLAFLDWLETIPEHDRFLEDEE